MSNKDLINDVLGLVEEIVMLRKTVPEQLLKYYRDSLELKLVYNCDKTKVKSEPKTVQLNEIITYALQLIDEIQENDRKLSLKLKQQLKMMEVLVKTKRNKKS